MPRANRHFLAGCIWHITHRCHQKQFLLKFPRDRRRYLHWVFQAKKRFGLSVLNYMVTSNHVRLLVNADLETFQRAHRQWVEPALGVGRTLREDRWSEAVAVGRLGFLES